MQIDGICSCSSLVIEFEICRIIEISKIEFFNFSGTERIKTNTTLNSNFYENFAYIYFLRRETKTDILETNFHVFKTRNIYKDLSP